jgi:hypothetical protein
MYAKMTLGHSCFNATQEDCVEAQVCPGLVAKARERWPMTQSPWSNNQGPSSNEAGILGKGQVVKPQGLNNHGL